MSESNESAGEIESDVHHRSVFEEPDGDPTIELVSIVAELKGVEENGLDPSYSWADNLLSDLYPSPPPPAAQAIVEFTYEGYRVTLHRDGHAVLMGRSEAK